MFSQFSPVALARNHPERSASKPAIKDAINTLYEEKVITVNTARTIYGKKAFIEFETVDVARDLATKIGML